MAHLISCNKEGLVGNSEADHLASAYTILLVEDEKFVRQSMEEALRLSGYTVLAASNAVEALEICHDFSHPPDLLLADLVMPGMSGGELAGVFRALHPQAGVLLMSGYAEELAPHTSAAGCGPHLRKPFSVETLIKAVSELLDANALLSKTAVAKV